MRFGHATIIVRSGVSSKNPKWALSLLAVRTSQKIREVLPIRWTGPLFDFRCFGDAGTEWQQSHSSDEVGQPRRPLQSFHYHPVSPTPRVYTNTVAQLFKAVHSPLSDAAVRLPSIVITWVSSKPLMKFPYLKTCGSWSCYFVVPSLIGLLTGEWSPSDHNSNACFRHRSVDLGDFLWPQYPKIWQAWAP